MTIDSKPVTRYVWFHSGILFLLVAVLPFMVQSLLFFAKVPVSPIVFPVCAIAVFAVLVLRLRALVSPTTLIVWVAGMVTLMVAVHAASVKIYDLSYDGMWYHQDAILLLRNGWIPHLRYLLPEQTSASDLYLNHYPKATWIAQACYYSFSGAVESAKALNFYLLLAVFFLGVPVLMSFVKLKPVLAIICAMLIALNPVVVCQLFSFYVDGMIAGLISCCVFLLLILAAEAPGDSKLLVSLTLGLALVFLCNIKFTSLVYACVLMAGYMCWLLWSDRSRLWKEGFFYAGVFVVAAGVAGYSTYVRNTAMNGHPFYPLMGENNIGEHVAQVPMPADFLHKNRFEKFNLATFARPVWSRNPLSSRPKPLFTISGIREYDVFSRADGEMSGFGPLYAEIFLLLVAGLVLFLAIARSTITMGQLILTGTLVISVVIMPEFWYARYAPQIWLLSLLLLTVLLSFKRTAWFGILILVLTFVNAGMVIQQNFSANFKQTGRLNRTFEMLRQRSSLPKVYPGWPKSVTARLEEQGVQYIPVKGNPPEGAQYFPGLEMSGAYYLPDSEQVSNK
jgi:hypothetical protein